MAIVLVHIRILRGVPRWRTGASRHRPSSCGWNTRTLHHARPLFMRSSGDYSAGVPRFLCHACAQCWNHAKNVLKVAMLNQLSRAGRE